MFDDQLVSAEKQSEICSVFSNPKRVLILWTLANNEKSVGDIAKAIGASLQNTSQHLRVMKESDILKTSRDGQTIFYRIAENAMVDSCLKYLLKSYPKPQ